jgi:pantoate--beta-alanine ligase
MQVVTTVDAMVDERSQWDRKGGIGLVPTMGYLHAGHLALVRQARAENARLVTSIFVNPTQFGPGEDLERYPRDMQRDLRLLEAEGVDLVFAPTAKEMYPESFVTYAAPTGVIAEVAEAAHRPGHFRGVATIVLKLLQIIQPDRAYFGQKDAQQAAVIAHLVEDFNLPTTLRIHPTVREADGLAMSSRNAYLQAEERKAATILYRALRAGQQAWETAKGSDDLGSVVQPMREIVLAEPRARLDYAEIRHPYTFAALDKLAAPALFIIAARVGPARLIDNFLLRADGSWDTGIMASATPLPSLNDMAAEQHVRAQ